MSDSKSEAPQVDGNVTVQTSPYHPDARVAFLASGPLGAVLLLGQWMEPALAHEDAERVRAALRTSGSLTGNETQFASSGALDSGERERLAALCDGRADIMESSGCSSGPIADYRTIASIVRGSPQPEQRQSKATP